MEELEYTGESDDSSESESEEEESSEHENLETASFQTSIFRSNQASIQEEDGKAICHVCGKRYKERGLNIHKATHKN